VRRHVVAALVDRNVAAFELGVVHEVFGLDRSEYADPWYEFRVVRTHDGPVSVTNGDWSINTPWTIDDIDDVDTLIVPVWPGRGEPTSPALLHRIREAHERGARIVSVCSGAFLLAEAGLLDGRRATTHWIYAAEMARQYPKVDVDPNVLFVEAGDRIYTSAGTAAGIDLCLHLVRLDHGAEVANAIARRMVVPPQRDGGQAQFVDAPVPDVPADDPIGRTLDWAIANLDQPLSVEDMARQAMVSPRSFARRFRAATGTTPMQWLARQRVLHAQRLLETTDLPVEIVAQRSGFGTATGLRMHFRRLAGTSPLAYRRAFRLDDTPGTEPATAGADGSRAGAGAGALAAGGSGTGNGGPGVANGASGVGATSRADGVSGARAGRRFARRPAPALAAASHSRPDPLATHAATPGRSDAVATHASAPTRPDAGAAGGGGA
jgi:transcriptional regulator GlxA family with amidase domain